MTTEETPTTPTETEKLIKWHEALIRQEYRWLVSDWRSAILEMEDHKCGRKLIRQEYRWLVSRSAILEMEDHKCGLTYEEYVRITEDAMIQIQNK